MSSTAQVLANQLNAQRSTGPVTETGKAASSQNNFRHGLTGAFRVLPSENQADFDELLASLRAEHQPSTITESILVDNMAQHHWLAQRAQRLQHVTISDDLPAKEQERRFSLYLRYQTTNERAFHRCLADLLKLRAERRRAQIGFESQKQKQAQESRRESAEKRKHELHEFAVPLAQAKVDHQYVLTSNARLDGIIACTRENIPLEASKAA
jgi:multidrug resistance efflux pump